MHSIAMASSGTSVDTWSCALAGVAVDNAITALNAAGATLIGLTADTEWDADGVRALHEKLVSFQSGVAVEVGRLNTRAWEIDRAAS